jgi:SAM-dependent methyltransferase
MRFFKKKLDANSSGECGDDLLCNIDQISSNEQGIYITGWMIHRKESPESVSVIAGNISVPIKTWIYRPDVIKAYPEYARNEKCGFSVYIPCQKEHNLIFQTQVGDQTFNKLIKIQGNLSMILPDYNDGSECFNDFIKRVNDNQLSVLEIGSRIVSRGSVSKRALFPDAKEYTGFDIYPDSNTDTVGDAHKLSQYFDDNSFDAVFSLSVFEHLAMPWIVAREINRVLKTGGITFHSTHFSWPIHETPWDFYRYSDEGLKALFPQTMGYKVLKSGLFSPLRMFLDNFVPGQEELPFHPGFGGVSILAEKKFDVDMKKFCWDTDLEEILDKDSHYPKKI